MDSADSGAAARDEPAAGEAPAEAVEKGSDPARDLPREKLIRLSKATFAEDVTEAFSARVPAYDRVDLLSDSRAQADAVNGSDYSIIEDDCAVDLAPGKVVPIRLDDEPAVLVLRRVPGDPDKREVLAYPAQCPTAASAETAVGVPLATATVELP